MIDELYKRKIIRDFLSLFSDLKWKELITLALEYGILNLKKNHNIASLSLEDLEQINENLKNEKNIHNKQRSVAISNISSKLNTENNESSSRIRSTSEPQSDHKIAIAIKPPSSWRKGDKVVFVKRSVSPFINQSYSKKESLNNPELSETRTLKGEIYPKWWGDVSMKVLLDNIKVLKQKGIRTNNEERMLSEMEKSFVARSYIEADNNTNNISCYNQLEEDSNRHDTNDNASIEPCYDQGNVNYNNYENTGNPGNYGNTGNPGNYGNTINTDNSGKTGNAYQDLSQYYSTNNYHYNKTTNGNNCNNSNSGYKTQNLQQQYQYQPTPSQTHNHVNRSINDNMRNNDRTHTEPDRYSQNFTPNLSHLTQQSQISNNYSRIIDNMNPKQKQKIVKDVAYWNEKPNSNKKTTSTTLSKKRADSKIRHQIENDRKMYNLLKSNNYHDNSNSHSNTINQRDISDLVYNSKSNSIINANVNNDNEIDDKLGRTTSNPYLKNTNLNEWKYEKMTKYNKREDSRELMNEESNIFLSNSNSGTNRSKNNNPMQNTNTNTNTNNNYKANQYLDDNSVIINKEEAKVKNSNYAISYDKNLKPKTIKEKSKKPKGSEKNLKNPNFDTSVIENSKQNINSSKQEKEHHNSHLSRNHHKNKFSSESNLMSNNYDSSSYIYSNRNNADITNETNLKENAVYTNRQENPISPRLLLQNDSSGLFTRRNNSDILSPHFNGNNNKKEFNDNDNTNDYYDNDEDFNKNEQIALNNNDDEEEEDFREIRDLNYEKKVISSDKERHRDRGEERPSEREKERHNERDRDGERDNERPSQREKERARNVELEREKERARDSQRETDRERQRQKEREYEGERFINGEENINIDGSIINQSRAGTSIEKQISFKNAHYDGDSYEHQDSYVGQESDSDKLSSYAPSERTKVLFKRGLRDSVTDNKSKNYSKTDISLSQSIITTNRIDNMEGNSFHRNNEERSDYNRARYNRKEEEFSNLNNSIRSLSDNSALN